MSLIIHDDMLTTMLPDGVSMSYLCRLTTVNPYWHVDVAFSNDLAEDKVAGLRVDSSRGTAHIVLNDQYHFSQRALTRTITHELLELQSIDQWLAFVRISRRLSTDVIAINSAEREYRDVRDHSIDYMLSCLPWFDSWDIPIQKTTILR